MTIVTFVPETTRVEIGAEARDITLVMPYYENPDFFAEQLVHWSQFPIGLRRHMQIVIVDDGSPRSPASLTFENVSKPDSLRLFRIDVDVRWNWLAARNIGVNHSNTEWVMMTDMDHMLPEDTLFALVYGVFDAGKIYRFSRREHGGEKIHPHPNSWFMTKKMFWKVGGYDEALSGYYGTDGEYRRRCASKADVVVMDVELERHEFRGDSSTLHYQRKQLVDKKGKDMIRARGPHWKPRVLTFPYHEVAL